MFIHVYIHFSVYITLGILIIYVGVTISFCAIHFPFFTMAKRSASDIRFTMDHCYLYNPLVFLLLISLFQAEELLAFAPSPSFRTKLNGGGGGGGGGAGNRNTRHDDPYQPHGYQQRQLQQLKLQELSEETEKVFETESTTTTMKKQTISLWKPPGRWWEPRIHINDVQVGQNLTGVIFQEFLNGTTGPKGELT